MLTTYNLESCQIVLGHSRSAVLGQLKIDCFSLNITKDDNIVGETRLEKKALAYNNIIFLK